MTSYNGEDLLNVFRKFNIDLRDLSPNVIRAWFDNDIEEVQDVLHWMCSSLTNTNYISVEHKVESDSLKTKLSYEDCLEELKKLDPDFVTELHNANLSEDIKLLENEIELLQSESKCLDNLILSAEDLSHDLFEEINEQTKLKSKLENDCSNSQRECVNLCQDLDNINTKLVEKLTDYDLDNSFNSFVDINEFQDYLQTAKSVLSPHLTNSDVNDYSETFNETASAYDDIEEYRKKILSSTQTYLINKIEISVSEELSHFLENLTVSSIQNWDEEFTEIDKVALTTQNNSLFQMLDKIAVDITDKKLNELKTNVAETELKDYQNQVKFLSKINEFLQTFLQRFYLSCSLQLYQNNSIKNMLDIYQKLGNYANVDLRECRNRIEAMEKIIEENKLFISSSDYTKNKFLNFIKSILKTDSFKSESLIQIVENFKAELNQLENKIFSDSDKIIQDSEKIREDIRILQRFIMSGPTNTINLVPLEFRKTCLEVEKHLKKEKQSITHAMQLQQTAKKKITPAQILNKDLWISFLTDPSRIDGILKKAEKKCLENSDKSNKRVK